MSWRLIIATPPPAQTVLHLAVSAGIPAIARHLVVCGASPVARDVRGNTPLHAACARKDPEMVTHLTRPVTRSEVMNARLGYSPRHDPGLLAADLYNYQGESYFLWLARGGGGVMESAFYFCSILIFSINR